jgi:hypothetical protein
MTDVSIGFEASSKRRGLDRGKIWPLVARASAQIYLSIVTKGLPARAHGIALRIASTSVSVDVPHCGAV